jgi:hypothetical protein
MSELAASATGPYGLRRPDLAEARQALERVYGDQTAGVWQRLLDAARLSGTETDRAALDRLLKAMVDTDPVLALCARSVQIRATAYDHLTEVDTIVRDNR